MRIDYEIQTLSVEANTDYPRLASQWDYVTRECRQQKLNEIERARLAFSVVDYVTSQDLPFRLLITRAPQAMAVIASEQLVVKRKVAINGTPGVVYCRAKDVRTPAESHYQQSNIFRKYVDGQSTTIHSDLLSSLTSGIPVTALDGILSLNAKRIALDISKIRGELPVAMNRITVRDDFTNTSRLMATYSAANVLAG